MGLKNIKLTITYDGTAYHGWQRQRYGIITVQEMVETAISRALGQSVTLRASGRTDTGVHALGQVANFSTDTPIPAQRMHRVITKYLPDDIRVIRAEEVGDDFDATLSARSKLYRYTVFNDYEIPLAEKKYCYQYYYPCNLDAMQKAATQLIGEHDFASFTTFSLANKRKTTVRDLLRCQVWRKFHYIYFDTEATGFLYHMVRNIVGTLLDVGRGRISPDQIPDILRACDRSAAGPMAPAQGLCLRWVRY